MLPQSFGGNMERSVLIVDVFAFIVVVLCTVAMFVSDWDIYNPFARRED
jgi:hypothetical protein